VVEGDGLVPVDAAVLTGAPSLVLDDIHHGHGSGRPWYGADQGLDAWWEPAVETWRAALRARLAARSTDPGEPAAELSSTERG
jgi:hypothetical protein